MNKYLLVTIPKNTPIGKIYKEIEESKKDGIYLYHKIGQRKPKKKPKQIAFTYNGEIRFVGNISGYVYKDFECTTTGVYWDAAWYIEHTDIEEILEVNRPKCKGFQGFRYVEDDNLCQIEI